MAQSDRSGALYSYLCNEMEVGGFHYGHMCATLSRCATFMTSLLHVHLPFPRCDGISYMPLDGSWEGERF